MRHRALLAVSVVCVSSASGSLPTPQLNVASIGDPRNGASPGCKAAVIGFWHPGHEAAIDKVFHADFLANYWAGPAVVKNFAPPNYKSDLHTFNCSEACFWASQWWAHASEFEGLDGHQVMNVAIKLMNDNISMDPTFGGFGNSWKMMRAALANKFSKGSEYEAGLIATGDAYLQMHQEGTYTDLTWSDQCDGSGANRLGLQLMLLRDELRGKTGPARLSSWTSFAASAYDLSSGAPRAGQPAWQSLVRSSAAVLNTAISFKCPSEDSQGSTLLV